jgi:type IV pilus assembly protein PilC
LDKLLNRLADTLEANRLLKAKIHNALIYPTCILAVAFGVVMVILVWVVPQFEEVFQSMGAQLPAPTQLLVSVSRGITQWGWLVLALCAMTGAFFMRAHRRSNALQLWWEAAICQLPIVGALLQSSRTANWWQPASPFLKPSCQPPPLQARHSFRRMQTNSCASSKKVAV